MSKEIQQRGGLWANKSKKGTVYLDLTKLLDGYGVKLNGSKVFAFVNKKREGKKDPDFSVVELPPKEENKTYPTSAGNPWTKTKEEPKQEDSGFPWD